MTTDKKRLSVGFPEEDYQWLVKKAEFTGNSRAAVLRQIVRGLRLGEPRLLAFGNSELVFADESVPTGNGKATGDGEAASEDEQNSDDSEEGGLEAFRRD